MNIHFWGVRGSLATPLTNATLLGKIETALQLGLKAGLKSDKQISEFVTNLPWTVQRTVGGDTACVEVKAGEELLILDAGTGIRPMGLNLMRSYKGNPIEAHILLTHTHWDHISGIPFFVPGYIPNNRIIIYGSHPDLEKRIKHQQDSDYFPVPLASAYEFVQLNGKSRFQIGEVEIETAPLNHPGGSYGYRIAYDNKTIVYATDSEYKDLSADALKPFTNFFRDADLLIFDAQYTMIENVEKEDWGHSNVFTGIDIALEANVKGIVFTHHEPTYDDGKLWGIMQEANEYLDIQSSNNDLKLLLAFEGLNIEI